MAKSGCQLRAEYSILPVWHTEWAFQSRHERKMSALALYSSDHRGRCFIKIRAAVTVAEQWKKQKWLRWQTKIDLALLCAFSSPHPSLFSIFRAPPGWRKWRKSSAERGGRDGKGRGGRGEWKRDNRDWEGSGSLETNRRALKAIYRPQGAGGGGAGSGSSAADTGITNNPTRHPVLLWSWAEGELLWLWRRHQPPISATRNVSILSFSQLQHLAIYGSFTAMCYQGHCCTVSC